MNFNLLRPVIFANLKVGEVLQAYSGLPPTVAYKAPTFAVLKFEDGSEGCYEIYKLETSYKLVPLCWVEGKPVYPGDVLYYRHSPYWPHYDSGCTAVRLDESTNELRFTDGVVFEIDDATWTKPEQKREPSFQVEGQDVFPGEVVYYYGVNKDNWGDPYTVEENGRVVQQVTGCGGRVKFFNGGAASFRLKPLLVIGDHLVPMPEREAPTEGTTYFTPDPHRVDYYGSYIWRNLQSNQHFLARGLVHLTKEAAIAHGEALIALSKKKG